MPGSGSGVSPDEDGGRPGRPSASPETYGPGRSPQGGHGSGQAPAARAAHQVSEPRRPLPPAIAPGSPGSTPASHNPIARVLARPHPAWSVAASTNDAARSATNDTSSTNGSPSKASWSSRKHKKAATQSGATQTDTSKVT